MKKLLLIVLLISGFAISGFSNLFNREKQLNLHPEAATYQSTRADGDHPDYMGFYLFIGNPSFMTCSPEAGENENQVIFRNISVHTGDLVMLQSFEGYWYYANNDHTIATSESPSIDLYFTGYPFAFEAFYGQTDLNAVYDIVVDYTEEVATMTFNKIEDYVFNPARTVLISSAGNFAPKMIDDHKALYSEITMTDEFEFYLWDNYSHIEMGWASQDGVAATPENPIATLVLNPDYTVKAKGFNGTYNLMVEYTDDFSGATVSFIDYVVPDELANYNGDLYVYVMGEQYANPTMKMTCVSPGLYQWEGEWLKTNFVINAGVPSSHPNSYIPDTDIHLWFGLASGYLQPGEEVKMRMDGRNINYSTSPGNIGKNVKLTLDLKNMTLLMNGDVVREQVPLSFFVLYTTGEDGMFAIPPTTTTDNQEAIFSKVVMDNIKEVQVSSNYFSYGWPKDSGNTPLTGDQVEIDLFTANSDMQVAPIQTSMTGTYDIYLYMSDDQMEGRLKFVKEGSGISESSADAVGWRKSDNGIEIYNLAPGVPVTVYSLSGSLLYKGLTHGSSISINLRNGDAYIIKVGDKAFKIRF